MFAKRANNPIQSSVSIQNDTLHIRLYNSGVDTLFLFNSYIELNTQHDCGKEPFWESEFLHRYDINNKTYKLSFLPLIPYLSVRFSDVITLGKQRILKKWNVLYSFRPILPSESIVVSIPKMALTYNYYTRDIVLKDYGKNDQLHFKRVKVKAPSSIIIEFAIYKKINLLTNQKAYYFSETDFDTQAKDYEVISVPCNVPR